MNLNRKKVIGIAVILVSLILTAAGYVLLPDTLVVQIGANGQASNALPKLPALLIPFALSTVFSVQYLRASAERKSRDLVIAIVGVGLTLVTFVMNYPG